MLDNSINIGGKLLVGKHISDLLYQLGHCRRGYNTTYKTDKDSSAKYQLRWSKLWRDLVEYAG
jgi:hypothetical protein